MKSFSVAYFEKLAEARQTYCAFCMRGTMPFFEDCEECKVNRMFRAAQAVAAEETSPEEAAAVEKTRNASDGIDLPREMIASLGKGPKTSDGFRTSPAFQLFITNGAFPDMSVQLVENKTGFPDYPGSDTEPASQSCVYYVKYNKGGVESEVQIWDLTPESLKEELKPTLERMLGVSIDQLWGVQALPVVDQHLILSRDLKEAAADMLQELTARSYPGSDAFGVLYSDEHLICCPRGSAITPQGVNMSGGLYMQLGKESLERQDKLFLEVRCTIAPEFKINADVLGLDAAAVAERMQGVVEDLVRRMRAE